jgi:hypothetical protein
VADNGNVMSQLDRRVGQVICGYTLIIVTGVQLSVKSERVGFAASSE